MSDERPSLEDYRKWANNLADKLMAKPQQMHIDFGAPGGSYTVLHSISIDPEDLWATQYAEDAYRNHQQSALQKFIDQHRPRRKIRKPK